EGMGGNTSSAISTVGTAPDGWRRSWSTFLKVAPAGRVRLPTSYSRPLASRLFYCRVGKRALDLVVTVPALFLFSPLLLAISLLVRRELGRPVLFCQQRPGLGERPFQLFKFRTMRDAQDANGKPLPDAERLTPFGQALRSASLDELP